MMLAIPWTPEEDEAFEELAVRYRALEEHAADVERRLLEAPPVERGEMAAEALATRARMLELERGAA